MLQKMSQWFLKFWKSPAILKFEEWLEEVFQAEKPLILAGLKDIAVSAVHTAERTGLNSSAKRDQAFTEISINAKNIGLSVGASVISLALEMAVVALRNSQSKESSGT